MSNQTHLELAIVEARMIAEHVPHGLPALQILRRPTAGPKVRLYAVGDIGLSGRAAATAQREGPAALFDEVRPLLRTGDLVFGNLEYPLAAHVAARQMFAASPGAARALKDMGFTVLHLANNHVSEYGLAGLSATLTALQSVGLTPLGVGADRAKARQLVLTNLRGMRIGWLGCGRTLLSQNGSGPRYWEFDEQELLTAIQTARPKVHILIVSIHIGFMYVNYPHPRHKAIAESLLRAGADLILMHHAHVLQGVQVTSQHGVCCYNLGNFLLDWAEGNVKTPVALSEQNEGAVFAFDLDKQGIALAALLPTWQDEDCCVHWATGSQGQQVLERVQRISRDLESHYAHLFERQRAERNASSILKVLLFHIRRGNWRFIATKLARLRPEHAKMVLRWLQIKFIHDNQPDRKGDMAT